MRRREWNRFTHGGQRNIWDEKLSDFAGKRPGDPDDIAGLCIFLKKIFTETPSEVGPDNRLLDLVSKANFDKHVGAPDEESYVWKKNPPSDLFYGIILAAIEDDTTRNELQEQIESKTLGELMRRINKYKTDSGMNHKEAFLNLTVVRNAERTPPQTVAVARVVQVGDTGATRGTCRR